MPRQSPSNTLPFGADFIPFDMVDVEQRNGDEIPGKRKYDQMEEIEPEQKQRHSKLARYEDGSFTTPWMRNMTTRVPKDAAEFFNEEVRAYAEYISPTQAENALRALIIKEIEIHARKLWPDATATAFGSYATGLYLPTGDIDIVIQTAYASTATKAMAQSTLTRLATVLRNAGLAERRRVQVIAARVPIVKFNSVHAGVAIDISLNQTTGLTAINVIRKYLEHFPALRPLILIVKSYLNQRGMNEVYKGGLGSYSIICMAISFLQMHPKVRLGEIDPSENLGVLLVEFFELYGFFFNYNHIGISINNGGSYFLKLQKGWYDMSKPWLLSIVDPTDDTNDVSRGSFQMLRLRQTLAGAALILTTRLLEVSEQIRSMESGYFFSLGRKEGSIQTVLGKLIAMSPEAVRQRSAIHDAYHEGRLQRTLNLPLPEHLASGEFEDSDETSDMNLSDNVQETAAKSLGRYAHPLSVKDMTSAELDPEETEFSHKSGSAREEEIEDSRYTAKAQRLVADDAARRTLNRFEALTNQPVQYVMSESDNEDGQGSTNEDDLMLPTGHARKRRRVELEQRPSQSRRTSKRNYWASKAQAD